MVLGQQFVAGGLAKAANVQGAALIRGQQPQNLTRLQFAQRSLRP